MTNRLAMILSWVGIVAFHFGLAGSVVASGQCGSPLFGALKAFPVGDYPIKATSGDFDGVNGPDLAVLNHGSSSLSILMNTGTGVFAPRVDYGLPMQPRDIAHGDFDGDSLLDLAITFWSSPRIQLLRNMGNGVFGDTTSLIIDSNYYGYEIRSADVDDDDDIDLAVSVPGRGVTVFRNNGAGGFSQQQLNLDYQASYALSVGEFDGVNGTDIVYGRGAGFGVYLNNSDATFSSPLLTSLGGEPTALSIIDLDDFGGGDVLALRGYLNVLYNNGDSTVFSPLQFFVGNSPSTMDIGFVDSDTLVDVIVCTPDARQGRLLLNNGFGGLSASSPFSTGEQVSDICTGDFDMDGKMDFALPMLRIDVVSTMLNLGSSEYVGPSVDIPWQSWSPIGVCVIDYDSDGHQDILVGSQYNGSPIFRNDGTEVWSYYGNLSNVQSICAGDFDGVNGPDLLYSNYPYLYLAIHAGVGFNQRPAIAGGDYSGEIQTANLDDDGQLDFVTIQMTTGNVGAFRNMGDSTFSLVGFFPGGQNPFGLAVADLDGVNGDDVVVLNSGNGLSVLLNTGLGNFGLPITYAAGTLPSSLATGDMNEDGNTDLVIAHQATGGRVSIRYGNGNGSFQHPQSFAAIGQLQDLYVGNLDGENGPDIAVSSLTNDRVLMLFNLGTNSYSTPVGYAVGWGPNFLMGADLDGVGGDDLVVVNTNSTNTSVILNSTNPCCDCPNHADPQADGVINVFDVVQSVNVAFRGAVPEGDLGCLEGAVERTDVNCDGVTSIFDVVMIIDVAFRGATPNFCNPCDCNPYPTGCP